jgi:hypothetical protein
VQYKADKSYWILSFDLLASQQGVNTVVVGQPSWTVMDCKVVNVSAVNELKLWV